MSANRMSALKCPETSLCQCILDFTEDSDAELGLDVEQDLDIEQSPNGEQSSVCEQGLDVLCLEPACVGVLMTLWCELTSYASTCWVQKGAVRPTVECG